MTTYQARAAALRLRAAALGLAPWACPDHAANLRDALAACPVSPLLAVVVRSSAGERWAVTRCGLDDYQIAHSDGRHVRGTAQVVVAVMEGER